MTSNRPREGSLTVGAWLRAAGDAYRDRASLAGEERGLAPQALLALVLGKPRSWALAHPEAILAGDERQALDDLFERLLAGAPLPYLTGRQEFFGLDFEVNPDVLIPRPETELIVEEALAWIKRSPRCAWAADVGTGSGCIAITLATLAPSVRWLAVDRSCKALQVAWRNAARHTAAGQVSFIQGDLLSACAGPFDLVCANLPYIPRQVLSALPVAAFEPIQALDGGEDGLSLVERLLSSARQWMAPGGLLLLEMQADQGDAILNLAQSYLRGAQVSILPDMAGLPRVVKIIRA